MSMKALTGWIVSLAMLLGASPVLAQTSSFQFLPKPGSYPVGVKVVDQYDRTRTFPTAPAEAGKPSAKEGPRPLQTVIWYPASRSDATPMTVGDYVRLGDTEIHFDAPHPNENHWRSRLQGFFDVPLWAVRDAKAVKGRFPVVIYAPSDSSVSWENADLCEYLASHGYVVIASASMGVSTRDMTDDLDGINAQASDISFLVTYAGTLSDADVSKIAVLSWSWGGGSSLFAAARDSRIDALVSMDGSMRVYPGLMKSAGDVHPERMTVPMLFFLGGYPNLLEDIEKYHDGPIEWTMGPNVLNAWTHGDLLTVNMLGMAHAQFSSMYQRKQGAQRFAENQVADYGRDDANTYHAWAVLYTLNFLDAYMKHDAAAMAFLKRSPAENGVPKHFMASSFRAAQAATTGNP
jgi:hypothetical protein